VNTSRQVGGAIGLAVLATLAGTTTAHAAAHQPHLEALTAGYRTAFGISAAVLAATAVLAAVLTRRGRTPDGESPATANADPSTLRTR
jgi:hypothetical protein